MIYFKLLGREFFVGITKKTNVAGAMEVAKAFPEYPVTPVKVNGPLHLKHYVCLASPNVIAVGSSKEAQNILKVEFFQNDYHKQKNDIFKVFFSASNEKQHSDIKR